MQSSAIPVQLNAIQAVRSLLYLPIYLAVERLKSQQISLNVVNPCDKSGAEIVGDAEAFNEFIRRADLHFCICDPMMVPLLSNEKVKEAVIVGTLIRKVALWSMSKDESLFDHVVASGRKFNIFDSPFMAGKQVASYSRPSTAGAIATYLRARSARRWTESFQLLEVENGLELQYLDSPIGNKTVDVVITADLLAFVAHYNYNRGARELHSFADDWDTFFFTGIITKRSMLTPENRPFVEKVLGAIKGAVTELYDYSRRNSPLPGGLIDELVSTADRYTMFHKHPALQSCEYDKHLIVNRAISLYMDRQIASETLEVDLQSFQNAFEIRSFLQKLPMNARDCFKQYVDNRIAIALDKRGKTPFVRRFLAECYRRVVAPHIRLWSIAVPSVAAIIFHVVARGSVQSIVVSVIVILIIAWLLERFLKWFGDNVA